MRRLCACLTSHLAVEIHGTLLHSQARRVPKETFRYDAASVLVVSEPRASAIGRLVLARQVPGAGRRDAWRDQLPLTVERPIGAPGVDRAGQRSLCVVYEGHYDGRK